MIERLEFQMYCQTWNNALPLFSPGAMDLFVYIYKAWFPPFPGNDALKYVNFSNAVQRCSRTSVRKIAIRSCLLYQTAIVALKVGRLLNIWLHTFTVWGRHKQDKGRKRAQTCSKLLLQHIFVERDIFYLNHLSCCLKNIIQTSPPS